jgi:hypothetical protein
MNEAIPGPIPADGEDGWYTSTSPLNMAWRPRAGVEVLIRGGQNLPLEAGVPFAIPAHLVAEFERAAGPSPDNGSLSETSRAEGPVRGLTRVQAPKEPR